MKIKLADHLTYSPPLARFLHTSAKGHKASDRVAKPPQMGLMRRKRRKSPTSRYTSESIAVTADETSFLPILFPLHAPFFLGHGQCRRRHRKYSTTRRNGTGRFYLLDRATAEDIGGFFDKRSLFGARMTHCDYTTRVSVVNDTFFAPPS